MIYIFQLPGMLASAVCRIIGAVCGGACRCSLELCSDFPEACACVADALKGVAELFRDLFGSTICCRGTLRWGLMLSFCVNGAVIWNAMVSMNSTTVNACHEADMSFLMKADLILAICHMVFVIYLNLRVERKSLDIEAEQPDLKDKKAQLLKKTMTVLIQYDPVVCLYFFVWVYSFYYNCTGVGLNEICRGHSVEHHQEWPGEPSTVITLLIMYGPLTVFYMFCLYGNLLCCAAREGLQGSRGFFRNRRAQAREGTASYLPLASGELPRGAAAPQV